MRTPTVIVLGILLAASVGARSAAALNAASAADNGPFPIALFPVENLSGSKAPLREIRDALAAGMRAKGLTIIDEGTTERFLSANRIRYAAGVTSELGQALHADTGAAGILIAVVELYDAAYPPRIGLICRLVASNDQSEILWMDSAGLSGADAQGFLRLGVIEDPKQILNDAVEHLADSLAAHFHGDRNGRRSDRGGYRPLRYYRSSALGKDLQTVRVGFARRASRIDGTSGRAALHVALSAASAKRVTVDYAVSGGTARPGTDYEPASGTVVFEAGETVKEIAVAVKDRMRYDDDRTVEVRLAKAVNAAPGDTQVHTLVIANTHPQPAVAFGEAVRRVREDAGTVTVPVRLSAVSGKDVTVPYTVSGTARAGYRVLTPSPLVIGAGSAGAEIAVEIVDDGLAAEEETVTLALDAPSGAVLGRATVSALHIEDDDPPPAASFAQERSRGAETAGPARLEVRLSGPSGRRVRVEYAVTGGTARGGAEYVLRGGALVFEPGETARSIEAEIRPGDRHREDRTLEVSLTRAEHAVLDGVRVHTYTIENAVPPPRVTFGEASGRVDENAGVVAVPVRLTALSGKDVTVPFTVSGTAVEGKDYRLVTPGPLVIRAGRSAADITLLVEDDRLQSDDRTIILTLGAPANEVLGPYASYQLTVLDNDRRRTVAVMPFLNTSTRKSAGDILTLHFIKHLLAAGRFSIIEPGEIRQHFLDTRLIMPGGIDLAGVDQISNTLQSDLLFSGTVSNYQDGMGAGVAPAIDFSVVVFERKSKRVVWASKSSARGDDRVVLFDWGRISVADVLASKMSGMVIDMFIQ